MSTVKLALSVYRKQQLPNKALVFQLCQKGVSTETMETCLDPPLVIIQIHVHVATYDTASCRGVLPCLPTASAVQ